MSGTRLLGTTAAMGVIAAALAWLTPSLAQMTDALLTAQRTADTAGAEALVLAAAGLLAWCVWSWGALGLLLTAGAALPGAVGSAASVLVRGVLPEGARRGAAVALGLSLSVAGPTTGTALLVATAPAAAAASVGPAVPDWPPVGAGPAGAAAPDVPARSPDAGHVVVPGDCLWDIADAHLADRTGRAPAPAETAIATHGWWLANSDVIGGDPDLLLPGQVLRPPPA